MMKHKISLLLRILAAVILLQTLYFKFGAHPESVALFSKLGVEPWGRIATGVVELFTAILLLIPSTKIYGAILTLSLMTGAIVSHLTVIGIESKGDGGKLFGLAIVVLLSSIMVLFIHKTELKEKLRFFLQ